MGLFPPLPSPLQVAQGVSQGIDNITHIISAGADAANTAVQTVAQQSIQVPNSQGGIGQIPVVNALTSHAEFQDFVTYVQGQLRNIYSVLASGQGGGGFGGGGDGGIDPLMLVLLLGNGTTGTTLDTNTLLLLMLSGGFGGGGGGGGGFGGGGDDSLMLMLLLGVL